jgi:polysaccharide biosynthesis protein PslH
MNIVFITMEPPFPANSGGRIYTYDRIRQLKKYNNIFLFALKEQGENVELRHYEDLCEKVNFYDRGNKYTRGIINLTKPFVVASRINNDMYSDIEKFISNNKIDIIVIDSPLVILNCPFNNSVSKVLTQHNVEFKLFESISKSSKGILKKIIYKIESVRMKIFEEKIYKKNIIQGYTFISDHDMGFMQKNYKFKNVCLIPQGCEIYKKKCQISLKNTIVFTGKMDYEPNVQGVLWFTNNVFPKIKKCIKDANLYIVGKNPVIEILKLNDVDNVVVTGAVEDVRPYLDRAKVYILPLLSGSGVKIKLFEALGSMSIVVTTSKGIEGTEFMNGEHILVANEEDEFAEKCVRVLEDSERYEFLKKNSIDLINKKYSWDSIGIKYNDFLTNTKKLFN